MNQDDIITLLYETLQERKNADPKKSYVAGLYKRGTKQIAKKMGEEAKIAIRNLRREQNDRVKKAEKAKEITEDDVKKYSDEIQKITDKYVGEVDSVIEIKEKELLTV